MSSLSRLYGLRASAVNLLFLSAVLFQPEAGIKPHSASAALPQLTATMSFQQILDKHRSLAFSERDKGSRFVNG